MDPTMPLDPIHAPVLDTEQHATGRILTTVGELLAAHTPASVITRAIALAQDALVARLIHDAEDALGAPPCPYAWLSLGSHARWEQTLHADQDNALVYANNAPPEAEGYFAALAERVVHQLVASGYALCPGGINATTPQWRQPLQVWQGYFRQWINVPEENALLNVTIFFDHRRVYGALDADTLLDSIIVRGRDQRTFLGRLARVALRKRVPLGFFHQLVFARRGEQRGLLDLKMRGSALIVDLARLYAIEAGAVPPGTLDRLRIASQGGSLGMIGAQKLAAAFELLNQLRLRYQYERISHGESPSNLVPVDWLSAAEKRQLTDALRAADYVQHCVAISFQTAWLA
jgi:CBS domain-containing protein